MERGFFWKQCIIFDFYSFDYFAAFWCVGEWIWICNLLQTIHPANKKGMVVSGTIFCTCTGECRMCWQCGRHIISAWNSTIWNRRTDASGDFWTRDADGDIDMESCARRNIRNASVYSFSDGCSSAHFFYCKNENERIDDMCSFLYDRDCSNDSLRWNR